MLENIIDWIAARCGWRVHAAWLEHSFNHRHEQIRAKFIQDGGDVMSQDGWYKWLGTLRVDEFIHVMLLDEPEKTDIEIAVDEVVGNPDV
jgi:hypothetical protein